MTWLDVNDAMWPRLLLGLGSWFSGLRFRIKVYCLGSRSEDLRSMV